MCEILEAKGNKEGARNSRKMEEGKKQKEGKGEEKKGKGTEKGERNRKGMEKEKEEREEGQMNVGLGMFSVSGLVGNVSAPLIFIIGNLGTTAVCCNWCADQLTINKPLTMVTIYNSIPRVGEGSCGEGCDTPIHQLCQQNCAGVSKKRREEKRKEKKREERRKKEKKKGKRERKEKGKDLKNKEGTKKRELKKRKKY